MVFHFISPNIKRAAIRIYKNGLMDLPDILDCLDMSESTFFCALRLYWETGNVEHPRSTTRSRPRKLHFDNLTYMIALINHRPDWFLDELLGLLDTNRFILVHFTMIYCELKCSGVSLKKLRRIAKERDENLRADFVRTMGQYSPEEIGILDEFSKDEWTLHQRRGHSKKGKHAVMRGAFVHGHQVSGEGLLTLDVIVASTVVEGSMTHNFFLHFLEHSVVSAIQCCCSIPSYLTSHCPVRCLSHHHILESWVFWWWTMHAFTTGLKFRSLLRGLVRILLEYFK